MHNPRNPNKKGMFSWFKHIDLLGNMPNFTFEGNDSYKTYYGSC
jgi:hypothetical protein